MSLEELFIRLKGSSLSGNFRHAGRPGKRGGSASGGGHYAIGIRDTVDKKAFVESWRQKKVKPSTASRNYDRIDHNDIVENYKLSERCGKGLDCSGIKAYTGGSYQRINDYLRHDIVSSFGPETTMENIKKIDNVMAKAPKLHKDIVTFRGFDKQVFDQLNPGTVFKDNGYYSTSIDKGVARSFGNYVVEVQVPKGSKGVYVAEEGISNYPVEREFILPRGSRFKVVSKNDDAGTAVVEVIP